MAGQPAARQGDATQYGGPIVQGSASVLIGAPSGIACSVCPGGLIKGNPVNPSLGAKVLPGETDLALPAPAPLVIHRSYSSYRTPTPGPVGLFGPGWQGAFDVSLQVRPRALILNDNGGRSLHFDALSAGEIVYSSSEKLWLARGGAAELADARHALFLLWQSLPRRLREDTHHYFVSNSPQGPWWVFGYVPQVPAADAVLPAPLPVHRPLLCVAERTGHQLRYLRDVGGEFAGRVTGAVDGAGRRFRLALTRLALPALSCPGDDGIRLTAVHLLSAPGFAAVPATPLARYEYGPRGELTAVYDRAGVAVRGFEYDAQHAGRMVAHHYAGRPVTTYEYNADGRVIRQHNPGGLDYRFEYDTDRTTVTDGLGRREVYHFAGENGLRRLITHERADGTTTHSDYDGHGRLTATTDAAGRKTEFDLDVASGSLCGITAPDGRQTLYVWNRRHQLTRAIAPDKTETTREYDAAGRLAAQADALEQTTRYHYADAHGDRVMAVELPDGSRQQLAWTDYHQLRRTTDCSGHATDYEYDLWGQVTKITREEGQVTRYRYDPRGRLTATENAAGEVTAYHYNAAGDRVRTVFPGGRQEDVEYDARGQRLRTLHGGLSQRFSYDAAGRVLSLINENGARTQFVYDVMDRLIRETGFDGRIQQYQYSAAGELIHRLDGERATRWHYDAAGRVICRENPPHGDGTPDEERRTYDTNGLPQAVVHHSGGHQVTAVWQRDATGRIVADGQQVTAPDGRVLWSHTQASRYGPRGVLTQTLPDGLPAVDWLTYGPGHLLGVALDGKPLLEVERDKLHRERTRTFGPLTRETRYDRAGRLSHLTLAGYPALSREHRYDERGQLTAIISGTRDDAGARQFICDDAGRLTVALGLYPAQYQYDPAGNRLPPLYHADPFSPARPDPRDAPRPALADNRIREDATFTYHYDDYGNLTEKVCKATEGEVYRYGYDSSHRLTHYSHTLSWGDGHSTRHGHYLYDPLGRRVGKRTLRLSPHGQELEPECVTWYGWEGDNLVVSERDGQRIHTLYQPGSFVPLLRMAGGIRQPVPTLVARLEQDSDIVFPPEVAVRIHRLEQDLRAGELCEQSRQLLAASQLTPARLLPLLQPVPETAPPVVHLYCCDHLGTPLALINPQGHVDWRAEFDPWGNQVDGSNPLRMYQPIRMQGQHYDEESGLHYNRHRYYDPTLGRYITQDPIGLLGGWNLYRYTSNPLQGVDPLGLSEFGKWAGSAFNLPEDQIAAALDVANGPYYEPPQGSISIEGGGSADIFTGASNAIGASLTTNEKSPIHMDACVYNTLCEHEGIGEAVGYGGTGTISESEMSSGKTDSTGYMATGGILGKLTISGTQDGNGKKSASIGLGPGEGAFVGTITCHQSTACMFN
ncbi:Cell wall-associated polypeptide CWBP200 [Campylobacter jejuni]|nr:Cell wall-associated polypeptide CWBP200 [Campylobacter jejuni]